MSAPDSDIKEQHVDHMPEQGEIDAYGITHPGKVRTINQDHFLLCSLRRQVQVYSTSLPTTHGLGLEAKPLAYLAMVADGVGGGPSGEEASRTAIEAISRYVAESTNCYYATNPTDEITFLDALQNAAMRAHASVLEKGKEDPDSDGMATTLTLWFGVWPKSYILQVGDSRCYLYRDNKLNQITRDQTMAQEFIDQGVFTRAEADGTRWANVLSSSIGGHQTAPTVTRVDQAWDHVGLLCSDGLTKHVPDERICERLQEMTSAQQVCENLLQDALDGGGTDNITIVVGRVVLKE